MSDALKAEIRRRMLARRAAITPDERQAAEAHLTAHLLASPQVTGASSILVYVSTALEAPTGGIRVAALTRGLAVYVPRQRPGAPLEIVRVEGDTPLRPGPHGILEATGPAGDPSSIEVAVVPGVAFARDGARLGHGGGDFDRLLAGMTAFRIGLAFAWQILDALPVEPHDAGMDLLITEEGTIRPERRPQG